MAAAINRFFIITFGLCLSLYSLADVKNSSGGFIDVNVYPYLSDVEGDNTLTINIASKLPHRFSYFSLTNFSNQDNANELEDTSGFYSEQNIRWQVTNNSPIDLTLQMNFRSGDEDNDRHRLGFRWRLNNTSGLDAFFKRINLGWSVNFHLLQFDREDPNVWQMEHVFKLKFPYLSDRLYLAGFIDHTFNQDLPDEFPSRPVVGEAQLGFRVIENLYAVCEYRVNEYRRADVNNLAVGVEYKLVW